MPQEAEDASRLAQIEDRLAAEDPSFVELFRRWQPHSGGSGSDAPIEVSARTAAVILVGLTLLMVGPTLAVVIGTLIALGLGARALCLRCHDGPPPGDDPRHRGWLD